MSEPREPHQILDDEAGGLSHKAFLLNELQVAAEAVYAEWEHDTALADGAAQLVAMCFLISKADIRLTDACVITVRNIGMPMRPEVPPYTDHGSGDLDSATRAAEGYQP